MSFKLIAPPAANEARFFFSSSGDREAFLFISLFVGLTIGAVSWPWMSDRLGRKWIFNSTLVLMGMGGLVGAGMPSFTGLCVVGSVIGFAVAGNVLIDAIILIEWVPASHQFLVCLQGAFWGLGELAAAAVGWFVSRLIIIINSANYHRPFISEYTCGTGPGELSTEQAISHQSRAVHSSSSGSCHYVSNKGWRYIWWTFGCITLFLYLCRFCFPLYETPKYLLSRRRDAEATQLVKDMASYNRHTMWLSEASFARIDSTVDVDFQRSPQSSLRVLISSTGGSLRAGILALIWCVTGLTFVLHPNYLRLYLSSKGVSAVTATTVSTSFLYSRYLYASLCGIPGPIFAAFLVKAKYGGRTRTGALIALLTGILMLVAPESRSGRAAFAFSCLLSCTQHAGLAILITYSVEIFAAPARGFVLGVMGSLGGIFGLLGMTVTTFNATVANGAAVWFSGAVWIVMAGLWFVLQEREVAA